MYFPITYRRVATARRIIGGTIVIWVITILLTIPTAYHVKGYNYNLVAKQVELEFLLGSVMILSPVESSRLM